MITRNRRVGIVHRPVLARHTLVGSAHSMKPETMGRLNRCLLTLAFASIILMIPLVQAQVPVPSPTVTTAQVPIAESVDRVVALMRREALARTNEHAAMFATIDASGNEGRPAVAKGQEKLTNKQIEELKKTGAVKGQAKQVQEGVMVKGAAVGFRVMMPAQAIQIQANQNVAMIQQWTTQMRPLLRMEYQFIRSVCEPTKAQRKRIAHAGELALREAASKYTDWQFGRNRVVANGVMAVAPDPRKIIQDGLLAAVKINLSNELFERYRKEIEERQEESKRTAIQALVTKLDAHLILSSDQREKVAEALAKKWDNGWNSQQAYFNLEYPYFPMIPDQGMIPLLSDAQKKVWAGTQKVNINSGFNIQQFDNGPLDDEFPDEVIPIEPKPEPNAEQPQMPQLKIAPRIEIKKAAARPDMQK